MSEDLPVFVRDLIASPPKRGTGLNNWFFRVAKVLHAFRSHDEIIALLEAATSGEPLQRNEIARAVARSKEVAWKPGEPRENVTRAPAWPKVNHDKRARIIAETGIGLVDLWEQSPIRLDDDRPHSEEIVDALFPSNPLLCCGKSRSVFWNKRREEWRGELARLALIVPSAMTAQEGLTQENKMSAHALSITGPRMYLIIEQDSGTLDEQASILWHFAENYAPLALAVHSGNKSLHGWFSCSRAHASEQAFEKFMRYAVSLGADHAPWTRSQFVRMPDGTENGRRQTVFYFNPPTLSLEKNPGHGPRERTVTRKDQ